MIVRLFVVFALAALVLTPAAWTVVAGTADGQRFQQALPGAPKWWLQGTEAPTCRGGMAQPLMELELPPRPSRNHEAAI